MRKSLYYFCNALGALALLSGEVPAMEEENPLNVPRLQTFAIHGEQDMDAAREAFNKQAAQAPILRRFPAFILKRIDENCIYGEVACKSVVEVSELNVALSGLLPEGQQTFPMLAVGDFSTNPVEKSRLEYLVRHQWAEESHTQ